ncbi:MAG TPA: PQQ-binding-like beta-propeller repeat protein [Candidatus Eremiobacteraceae bacterium]|nr:PQQ-binding-like beta-propeller repeat protein [Candidatus Eremiobacteraceae bacterium]
MRAPRAVVLASALAIGASACSAPQSPVGAPLSSSADWPTYNRTLTGERFSALSEITAKNVAGLKPLCHYATGEAGAFQAGIVIAAGVMYFTTPDNTYAVNAKTCELLWKNEYQPVGKVLTPVNRGVAYDGVNVYRGTPDAHFIAINAKTGKTIWDVKVANSSFGAFLSAAPIVWDGLAYIGLAGAEFGVRGKMFAFDTATGHVVWTFDPIPGPHDVGGNTWANAQEAATGGGSTWTSYTLDSSTGELFVPVGNPGPDFSGDYRPGANLFTDSLVVLDAKTGKLKWWYQLVPHDVFDYDLGAPAALVTTSGGKNLAVVAGKNGYLYGIDRLTHKPLYKVAVTTIVNQSAAPTPQGTHVCPTWTGGVEWNGPAYDAANDQLLVNSDDWCGKYVLTPGRYVAGRLFLGGAVIPDPFSSARGWLYAIDADTGKVNWRYHSGGPLVAAITPTAGGLVFTGDMTGQLLVFDAKSGALLFKYKTPGSLAGGVVTYTVDGKQLLAVTSGNVSRTGWSNGASTIYVFGL